VLRFAHFEFDELRAELRGPADEIIRLRPKPLAMLQAFLANAGRTLSKHELMQAVWPDIHVTEDSLFQCIREIRTALGDSDHQLIRRVSGGGYVLATCILTAPGRGDRLIPDEDETAFARSPSAAMPPRLSIVVLPFANIGGDPKQDYFVDGVTESLTTDLSRLAGSFVIARNTALTYKGKPYDVTTIGRELDVRYVLEGSVQRGGNRMRVNVQLIDAGTGHHLWAERFDKHVGDLFEMQDEIVARLANQLSTALIAQEARRAAKSPNPDSMDHYFQGTAWYEKSVSRDNVCKARGCFERALALDPDNVDALVGLGFMDATFGIGFYSDDREMRLASAEASAKRALSLAPDHALGHVVLGAVYVHTGRAEESIAEFERAIELDRNLALAHSWIGAAKAVLGRAEETEAHVRQALRLSPKDSLSYSWLAIAGAAKLCLGAYEEAAARLRRSIEANRNYIVARLYLSAALAHLGRIEEARSAAKAGLALDPAYTIRTWRTRIAGGHRVFVAQMEHIIDGIRMAGVPE